MIEIKKGNIFTTQCQTIVNTVNTVGVMGAGIAYEFKLRFPDMFKKYKKFCEEGQIDIGKLWIYKIPEECSYEYIHFKYILNFPTKKHWKYPTKIEYIELGLKKFVNTYKEKGITSIAFPLLGADKGKLNKEISLNIMKKYLENVDIKVEIWLFDPSAEDDLYKDFKNKFLKLDIETIKSKTGLNKNYIKKVKDALLNEKDVNSISGLLKINGIGDKTLEKIFNFIRTYKNEKTLFDF